MSPPAESPIDDRAPNEDDVEDAGDSDRSEDSVLSLVFSLFPSVMMARRNLSRNRVRSALAAFGIVIGVIAIAAIAITGNALQYSATQNIGDLGNEMTVFPARQADSDELTERQIRNLQRIVPQQTVIPVREPEGRSTATARGEDYEVEVEGMSNPAVQYEAASGSIPTPFRQDALISESFAEETDLRPGGTFQLDGRTYHVRAVLTEESTSGGFGGPSHLVVIPAEDIDMNGYSSATIILDQDANATVIEDRILEEMNTREEVVNVFSQAAIQDQISSFFASINMGLLAVGAISLLVASVSILNVMLMSTIERRAEIGVLRAVGVPKFGVMRMVLAEALLLGGVGGIVGVVITLAYGISLYDLMFGEALRIFTWENLRPMAMGFGFAIAASLMSGLYPAWKAANEHPVEALRG